LFVATTVTHRAGGSAHIKQSAVRITWR